MENDIGMLNNDILTETIRLYLLLFTDDQIHDHNILSDDAA